MIQMHNLFQVKITLILFHIHYSAALPIWYLLSEKQAITETISSSAGTVAADSAAASAAALAAFLIALWVWRLVK